VKLCAVSCSPASGGFEFDVLSDSLLGEDDIFYPAILMSSLYGLGFLVVQVPIHNLLQVPNWAVNVCAHAVCCLYCF